MKGSLVCFVVVFFFFGVGGGGGFCSSDLIYGNKLFAFMWLPQSVATVKYEGFPAIYCVHDSLLGCHARQLSCQVSGGTLSLVNALKNL